MIDISFKPVFSDRKQYLPLLLLADPDEKMIDRYLEHTEMFVACRNRSVVAEAVVDKRGEIKNIAVLPTEQQQGVGRCFLDYLCDHYRGHFDRLWVGTSQSGVGFYEHCGFVFSHEVKNFFIDYYSEPIIENGERCIDMYYLFRIL